MHPEYTHYLSRDQYQLQYWVRDKKTAHGGPQSACFVTIDDKLHNLYGPARITQFLRGSILDAGYYVDNQLHHTCGPAFISYSNYKITRVEYIVDGYRHNQYGPAIINFSRNHSYSHLYYCDNPICTTGDIQTIKYADRTIWPYVEYTREIHYFHGAIAHVQYFLNDRRLKYDEIESNYTV